MGQFLDIEDDAGAPVQSEFRAKQAPPGTDPLQVAQGQAQAITSGTEQDQQRIKGAIEYLRQYRGARPYISNETQENDYGMYGGEMSKFGREAMSQLPGGGLVAAALGTSPDEAHEAVTRHSRINDELTKLSIPLLNMQTGGGGGSRGGGGGGGGGSLVALRLLGRGGGEGGSESPLSMGSTNMTKDAVLGNMDSAAKYALSILHPNGLGANLNPGYAARMIGTDQKTLDRALALGRWPTESDVATRGSAPRQQGQPQQQEQPPAPSGQPAPQFAGVGTAQAATPQPGGQPAAAPAAPIRVNSEAELVKNVPIGGRFVGPSGKVRIRTK